MKGNSRNAPKASSGRDDRRGFESAPPDRELVTRIRVGDSAAFEVLFQRYYVDLCDFAVMYTSDLDEAREIVQSVFVRLWENRERWVVETSLRSYLFSAVRNSSLNHHRSIARLRDASLAAGGSLPILQEHTPEDEFCHMEQIQAVHRAIDQLPERQRAAFLLHRRHGMNYREIAAALGISERTVEVHIARALRTLYLALRD